MKFTNIVEHPEVCYHCALDDEMFDGYFVEVKDDGNIVSAYLCEKAWPRRKEFIAYEYKFNVSLERFIESLQEPITASYINFVFKRLSSLEEIPS